MPIISVTPCHQLKYVTGFCCRAQPFASETKRIEYLFELYDKYTADLFTQEMKPKKKK